MTSNPALSQPKPKGLRDDTMSYPCGGASLSRAEFLVKMWRTMILVPEYYTCMIILNQIFIHFKPLKSVEVIFNCF